MENIKEDIKQFAQDVKETIIGKSQENAETEGNTNKEFQGKTDEGETNPKGDVDSGTMSDIKDNSNVSTFAGTPVQTDQFNEQNVGTENPKVMNEGVKQQEKEFVGNETDNDDTRHFSNKPTADQENESGFGVN